MPSPDPAAFPADLLAQFETIASDDTVKRDLELTHLPCGQVVCDVEDSDTLSVLAMTAVTHAASCPASDTSPALPSPVGDYLQRLARHLNAASHGDWGSDELETLTVQMELYGVDIRAGLEDPEDETTAAAPGPVQDFLHNLAVHFNTTMGRAWHGGDVQAELIRLMQLHGVDVDAGLNRR